MKELVAETQQEHLYTEDDEGMATDGSEEFTDTAPLQEP